MSNEQLTLENGVFVGTFQHNDLEYTIIKEDYESIPLDMPEELLIQAAKQVAMTRCVVEGSIKVRGREANNRILRKQGIKQEDSPVPRFMGTVLVVDGTNIAYKAHYAVTTNVNGRDTSVLTGFLNILFAEAKKIDDLMGIFIAWDWGYPDYRKELVETYKESRNSKKGWAQEEKEEFYAQMDVLHEALSKYSGIHSIKKHKAEADDIIAGICAVLHPDIRKIILSTDTDMLQLVDYHCHVLVPGASELITPENFELATGGVKRREYLTYKAMVGDTSDNVAGIKGIGDVKAKEIINEYGGNYEQILLEVRSGKSNMPEYIVSKLSEFGIEGFEKTIGCISLEYDLVGARYEVVRALMKWQPFDKLRLKTWLMQNGLVDKLTDMVSTVKNFDSLSRYRKSGIKTPVIVERKPLELEV